MQIGILMAGHARGPVREARGDFDAMFARLLDGQGLTFQAWDVEGMEFPHDVGVCDGWLVTGSRHGVYEDHAFIPPLEDFIREAHAAKVPMVGICFGHQIVAQALGGRVEKWSGGWAVGRHEYRLGSGGTVTLNAWHQDQVTALPPDATVLASSAFCENAVVAYGNRALTIQAHPEFDGAVIDAYVALLRGTADYPDDRMDMAAAGTSAAIDSARIATAIATFYKTGAAHV
jgi:GMP synthase-like glutamine amidotransferase